MWPIVSILACCLWGATEAFRPDGTIACDPALKPYIYNNVDNQATVISTPGFDEGENYGPNLDCEWRILGGDIEVYMEFRQSSVIEDCIDCGCDAVEIYGVNAAEEEVLLRRLCGNLEEYTNDNGIASTSTTIVRFKTDAFGNGPGFRALFTFLDGACLLDGGVPVDGTSGFITSPDFPNNYGNDLECRWNFSPAVGQVVEWQFHYLDTEAGCTLGFDSDYVEFVEESETEGPRVLGRWYSIGLPMDDLYPWTFRSRSPDTYVTFTSDGSVVGGGFNLSYAYVDE